MKTLNRYEVEYKTNTGRSFALFKDKEKARDFVKELIKRGQHNCKIDHVVTTYGIGIFPKTKSRGEVN